MGQEFLYGIGALALLIALLYGVRQYHYRDRGAVRQGDQIVKERYRNDDT